MVLPAQKKLREFFAFTIVRYCLLIRPPALSLSLSLIPVSYHRKTRPKPSRPQPALLHFIGDRRPHSYDTSCYARFLFYTFYIVSPLDHRLNILISVATFVNHFTFLSAARHFEPYSFAGLVATV